jgi:hypothetical protein
MEALVTIAGGQQQIVVEQQTAGNQVKIVFFQKQ